MNRELRVCAGPDEAANEAALIFGEIARSAIEERGVFTALLSGGSTPRPMYERLVGLDLKWDRVQLFWGDERAVPPESERSNYRMAFESWISKVPIPESNVHRIPGELADASEAAMQYEHELSKFLQGTHYPRFDLAIQGLGEDGHTASLFPGSTTELDSSSWVIAPFVEKLGEFRISVSLGVLNAARNVLFLVTGQEKAEIVAHVLRPIPEHQALLPAQRVLPSNGRLIWILDQSAAKLMFLR